MSQPKVIVVGNEKGGAGKSTLAIHIATALLHSSARVSVLDLDHPTDKTTIKSQYRDMAKRYHPDMNGNSKKAEDAFKKVTEAYQYLMNNYREA